MSSSQVVSSPPVNPGGEGTAVAALMSGHSLPDDKGQKLTVNIVRPDNLGCIVFG